ncbi:hypothetical protein [Abyssalbus ytuae]|uniref:Uncharacterized protein n=1 Tax=Abyssalbus ytuae TaxID=2926907 RepID=A0A9E6ZKU2_9FLAO|nr:hypothetical protein [Abyssalbus ytuae]UOB17594.1 hypothetical protein MQE35_17875 [Abyssalbus ytuae]
MKLLLVTVVEEYHDDVLQLFKEAKIESFSESDIDGYKNAASLVMTSSWFPGTKGGAESNLFFSFTDEDKIDKAFELIKGFNNKIVSNNPVKAVVLPIEKYI